MFLSHVWTGGCKRRYNTFVLLFLLLYIWFLIHYACTFILGLNTKTFNELNPTEPTWQSAVFESNKYIGLYNRPFELEQFVFITDHVMFPGLENISFIHQKIVHSYAHDYLKFESKNSQEYDHIVSYVQTCLEVQV